MFEALTSLLATETIAQEGIVRGKYYERSGSCHQCGQCCNQIYLIHGDQTIDSRELFDSLQKDVEEYQHFTPVKETEHGLLFQCAHLTPDNECGIYESRPLFCRKYPSEKSLLLGGNLAEECGYRFKPIFSFSEVLSKTADKKTLKPGKLLS